MTPTILFSCHATQALAPHHSTADDQARLEAAARDVRAAIAHLGPDIQVGDFELHGQALRASAVQPGEYLVETLAEIWSEYEPPESDSNPAEQGDDDGLYHTEVPGGGFGTVYAGSRADEEPRGVE